MLLRVAHFSVGPLKTLAKYSTHVFTRKNPVLERGGRNSEIYRAPKRRHVICPIGGIGISVYSLLVNEAWICLHDQFHEVIAGLISISQTSLVLNGPKSGYSSPTNLQQKIFLDPHQPFFLMQNGRPQNQTFFATKVAFPRPMHPNFRTGNFSDFSHGNGKRERTVYPGRDVFFSD